VGIDLNQRHLLPPKKSLPYETNRGVVTVFKAVVCDLFGTLVDMYPFHEDGCIREIAASLDVPASEFSGPWLESYAAREEGKYASVVDCINLIGRQSNRVFTEPQLSKAIAVLTRQTREALTPRPGCLETLREIRALGLRIGLISGCSPELLAVWNDTPLSGLVDATVFTCVEGIRKPDPRIYQEVCTRLGVQTQECVYVADGTNGELTGALQAGMHPVLMRVPYDQEYDFLRPGVEEWQGTRVSGLGGILRFVSEQQGKPHVSFYRIGQVPDEWLHFAVVAARSDGKWVVVRHKSRTTWEIPGGHREAGEKIEDTAARELVEETGATSFSISAIADYSVTFQGEETFGRLFFAEIGSMGPLPDSEMGEIALVEHLPADLTYPDIQPFLSERAHAYVRRGA
jgi:HAD superfamily hydrolase (TIGR01509 family)